MDENMDDTGDQWASKTLWIQKKIYFLIFLLKTWSISCRIVVDSAVGYESGGIQLSSVKKISSLKKKKLG